MFNVQYNFFDDFLYNCQKGGKEGNPPDMGKIFFETRKKNRKLVEPEAEEKYVCSTINFC